MSELDRNLQPDGAGEPLEPELITPGLVLVDPALRARLLAASGALPAVPTPAWEMPLRTPPATVRPEPRAALGWRIVPGARWLVVALPLPHGAATAPAGAADGPEPAPERPPVATTSRPAEFTAAPPPPEATAEVTAAPPPPEATAEVTAAPPPPEATAEVPAAPPPPEARAGDAPSTTVPPRRTVAPVGLPVRRRRRRYRPSVPTIALAAMALGLVATSFLPSRGGPTFAQTTEPTSVVISWPIAAGHPTYVLEIRDGDTIVWKNLYEKPFADESIALEVGRRYTWRVFLTEDRVDLFPSSGILARGAFVAGP